MKVLLVAVNAKYIHSNLAVYSLRAYAEKKLEKEPDAGKMPEIKIKEYTINQTTDEILGDIYRENADLIAFSCYLWNIAVVEKVVPELRKLKKNVKIWYGGPEVSYHAEEYLAGHPYVDGIMTGEGEETFTRLLLHYQKEMEGGCFEKADFKEFARIQNSPALSMNELPFPYEAFPENKILYYETSRGCPFSCSYCLSSCEQGIRFRSLSLVFEELSLFLEAGVAQVKFIDRTFNANKKHAMAIWQFIKEHDNGITNFHFEVAADILDEEELSLLSKMRKGLVQLEIGVQSTNMESIQAVCRHMDLSRVKENVKKVKSFGNIHQHLDLIAGLPLEDYDSFTRSFDEVYGMEPEQLQLGFLKVLKGTKIEADSVFVNEKGERTQQIIYRTYPPYEVLCTTWISYEELLFLKDVEEMVESYYNAGTFQTALKYLLHFFERPFALYEKMAGYYREKGEFFKKQSRMGRYELLYQFGEAFFKKGESKPETAQRKLEVLAQCLTYDFYEHENAKSRPGFSKSLSDYRDVMHGFYQRERKEQKYLGNLVEPNTTAGQLARMTHMEFFDCDVFKAADEGDIRCEKKVLLFDYRDGIVVDITGEDFFTP